MDISFHDHVLRIVLPERISAENSRAVTEELFAIEHLKTAKEIILDAENLTYISSLGLRVILQLKKQYKTIPLVVANASEKVYDIFDVTGFTSFLNIKKKLRVVDTAALHVIGSGMYGSVYRINEEQILKVFHSIQSDSAIQPVLEAIRVAFIHGLPTLIPFEIVRTEKGIGMILELIHSDTLSTLMAENPQNLDQYIQSMLELSKTLAATTFEEGSLRSRNDMLKSKLNDAAGFLSSEEIAVIASYIDAIPRTNTAVHGDFHAKNLMVSEDSLMLIDMDEFSCGHPIWDVANLYCIYQAMVHMDPKAADDLFAIDGKLPYEDFYFKIIGCTFAQADMIWNQFFQGYFHDASQEDKEKILQLVEFYGNFKFITFLIDVCNAVKDHPDPLARNVQKLRYYIDKLKQENLDRLLQGLDLWK